MKTVRVVLMVMVVVVVLAVVGTGYVWNHHDRNVLRHIVLEQCVPNQRINHLPAPCTQVNLHGGYVLLKDRNGPLQHLLMPAYRINGMESPLLLNPHTPNFFWLAWQSRGVMGKTRGAPVPDSAISLAINSRTGRSQDHFHIHISCLRQDVRLKLDQAASHISSQWLAFPGGLMGHPYLARRVTAAELVQRSPFFMLAGEVPQASKHMGRYALAMVSQTDGSFVLLATERNLLTLNHASSEEIQDHQCDILK